MLHIAEQPEFVEAGDLTVNWHKKKGVEEEAKEEEEVDQYMDNANIAAILNEFNLLSSTTDVAKTAATSSSSAAA